MLAAFDFYGWRRYCDRTAERASRLPTLLALPRLVFTVRHGLLMLRILVSLSRWDHFVSAGCRSFCVSYSCRFIFCTHAVSFS